MSWRYILYLWYNVYIYIYDTTSYPCQHGRALFMQGPVLGAVWTQKLGALELASIKFLKKFKRQPSFAFPPHKLCALAQTNRDVVAMFGWVGLGPVSPPKVIGITSWQNDVSLVRCTASPEVRAASFQDGDQLGKTTCQKSGVFSPWHTILTVVDKKKLCSFHQSAKI